MKKIQSMLVISRKWVWLATIANVAVAGKKAQQCCAPAEKSVINMI
jgi:hypothetical protein